MNLIYIIEIICFAATQTDWVGRSLFHKATQFPIIHYSSDELRSMSADLVPVKSASESLYSGETGCGLSVATQTERMGMFTFISMHGQILHEDLHSKQSSIATLLAAREHSWYNCPLNLASTL